MSYLKWVKDTFFYNFIEFIFKFYRPYRVCISHSTLLYIYKERIQVKLAPILKQFWVLKIAILKYKHLHMRIARIIPLKKDLIT
ncbi:hypothetical protein A9Q83_17430 [Alphaproteobacteria bacterium 46_93_T64]|nr:hypothetical protein A9Q83_17430 [Alphaproteobacteria bacterium 46_93_T64]